MNGDFKSLGVVFTAIFSVSDGKFNVICHFFFHGCRRVANYGRLITFP